MKNRILAILVVVLLIATQSCSPRSPSNESHLADAKVIGQSIASLPVLDPAAPLPSPGAAQLKTMLADEPGIIDLIGDVETAEQAALQAAVAELQSQQSATGSIPNLATFATSSPDAAVITNSSSTRQSPGGVSFVSFSRPRVKQQADSGISAAMMIGLITSMFTDMFSVPGAMPTRSFTQTEKEGNVTSDMSMEIGRSEDGSSHFGLGLKSEGTENGVSVKTDLSAVVDGQRCPTAEGQVSFSIKARISSEFGRDRNHPGYNNIRTCACER